MHTFVDGELLTAAQLNSNFGETTNLINNKVSPIQSAWMSDTGWLKHAANGGWDVNSSLTIRRVGKIVQFSGKIANGSDIIMDGTSTNVATLAPQYRPGRDLFIPAALRVTGATPNYTPAGVLQISYANGGVSIHSDKVGAGLFFEATWIAQY